MILMYECIQPFYIRYSFYMSFSFWFKKQLLKLFKLIEIIFIYLLIYKITQNITNKLMFRMA
jgi:hypothetical protein